jgi:hypothetical protein
MERDGKVPTGPAEKLFGRYRRQTVSMVLLGYRKKRVQ